MLKRPLLFMSISGLPHTQGIQENSENFQVVENLREIQGILIIFLDSGKLKAILIFLKILGMFQDLHKNLKVIFFWILNDSSFNILFKKIKFICF